MFIAVYTNKDQEEVSIQSISIDLYNRLLSEDASNWFKNILYYQTLTLKGMEEHLKNKKWVEAGKTSFNNPIYYRAKCFEC